MSSGKLHADWLEVFEVNTRKTSCRTESNRDGNTTAARPKRTGDEISKCGVSHCYPSVSVISTPKLNNNMIKTRKNVNFTEQWGRWELPMSYVEANKCSGSRSSDLKTSFFFVCVLWLLSSLPRCLCWQRWCKIYVSDLHSRQMHRALKKKLFFWGGGGLQFECKGSKAGTKQSPQSPLSPLTSRIKGISTFGLQCIILCQRIGLIGTKPDTFVAKKKKKKNASIRGP